MQNRNVQVTICPPVGVVAASYSGWVPAPPENFTERRRLIGVHPGLFRLYCRCERYLLWGGGRLQTHMCSGDLI